MYRNCMRFACFVTIGLYSAVQSMDRLRLDLWQIDPQELAQPADLEAIRNSLGTPALTHLVPVYTQHWAYVGILRQIGLNDQANAYRDNVMPGSIREQALQATIGQIRATMEETFTKRALSVFDVMKAWACIALLHEKSQDVQADTDRLVGKLAGASLPQAYEKMLQQRRLASQVAAAHGGRQAIPAHAVPAGDQAGPQKDRASASGKQPQGEQSSSSMKPAGQDQGSQVARRPMGPRSQGGEGQPDFEDAQDAIGIGLDAIDMMLARHYADIAERRIDPNDLLANVAFIRRCLRNRRIAIGRAIEQVTAGSDQREGDVPQNIEGILRQAQTGPFDEPVGAAPLNFATTFPALSINGQVVPSLQQARSDENSTNYCGYYALYNALMFCGHDDTARLNRADFIRFFEVCLQVIGHIRGHGPYDNLSAQELRTIIDQNLREAPIAVVEMTGLVMAVQHPELTLEQVLDNDQRSAELLLDFINGRLPELSIIAGLGAGFGHWIAIHATRTSEGDVSIRVADSLHQINFYNDQAMVDERILPFYAALATPIQHWSHVLGDLLHTIMQTPETRETKPDKGVSAVKLPKSAPVASLASAAPQPGASLTSPKPQSGTAPVVKPLPVPPTGEPKKVRAPTESAQASGSGASSSETVPVVVPLQAHSSALQQDHDQAQFVNELARLRAQVQDLNQVAARETEAHRAAVQELERLRAENAELRRAAPERIDGAAIRAENVQLRQDATRFERVANAEQNQRRRLMGEIGQHAFQVAEMQRHHDEDTLALRRRVQELERQLAAAAHAPQAPTTMAPAAHRQDGGQEGDRARARELQEQLAQAEQGLAAANMAVVALAEHFHVSDEQLGPILESFVQAHPGDGPDAQDGDQ